MTAHKKRRKLPEEDLAAAVADIINSPITRSNLSFLRPLPPSVPEEEAQGQLPMGVEVKPMGVELKPMGDRPQPMGHSPTPMGYREEPAVPVADHIAPQHPLSATSPTAPSSHQLPMGFESRPMGFTESPPYIEAPLLPLRPPGASPPSAPIEEVHAKQPPSPRRTVEAHTAPVTPSPPAWQPAAPARTLWQAEGQGTILEQARVRRIVQAQDALSLVEEKVYDLLWGTKNLRKDDFRLVHYSLQRIATEARINIKTVRELIPRLIEKGFIHVEHEADARRNIPTLYRVFSYASVLSDQKQRNRLYVAKTGKGVVYVHAVSASLGIPAEDRASKPMGLEPAPMGVRPMGLDSKPTGLRPMGPMGLEVSKPMGSVGTLSIGILLDSKNRQTTTSPAAYAALIASIRDALALEPDTTLLAGMIEACHTNALETTGEPADEDDLVYFTTTKAKVISRAPNIRNHLAVLRKAVPECFLGESYRAYRSAAVLRKQKLAEEQERTAPEREQRLQEEAQAEARYALWARVSESHKTGQGYDMQAIAADPLLDEQGRQQAQGLLERLGRFTPSGL